MENRYKRAAQLLDKLYKEMPDNSYINESEVKARFKKFQKSFSIDRLAAFEGIDINQLLVWYNCKHEPV